ncbi:hypothetical protein [Sphingobium yanoikuyae]|uniref:hypothetical protein n=1 Tax=Sphingobium yanoikuyae TaxID=13690 RepID=UPI0022DDFA31|nr:hypothetical protein [Sphingobium yanoikuyae]WBQ16780.1 hypothetical protein PAE53_00850 [Sphingobium yanoikuyae]
MKFDVVAVIKSGSKYDVFLSHAAEAEAARKMTVQPQWMMFDATAGWRFARLKWRGRDPVFPDQDHSEQCFALRLGRP